MLLRAPSEDRLYHLGPYPLEILPRDDARGQAEAARPPVAPTADAPTPPAGLGEARQDGHIAHLFLGTADRNDQAVRPVVMVAHTRIVSSSRSGLMSHEPPDSFFPSSIRLVPYG